MGAGKSSVGRRLAARLGIPFVDADAEIEKRRRHDHRGNLRQARRALFPRRRDARDRAAARERPAGAGDRRRRLHGPATRATLIRIKGISVWLKADLEVLMKRIKRRGDRPLRGQDRRTLLPRARSDLCAGRHHRAVARRAARNHRRRDHRRGWSSISPSAARSSRHDRAAAPRRARSPWCRSRSASAPTTSPSGAACWRRSARASRQLRPGAKVRDRHRRRRSPGIISRRRRPR